MKSFTLAVVIVIIYQISHLLNGIVYFFTVSLNKDSFSQCQIVKCPEASDSRQFHLYILQYLSLFEHLTRQEGAS